MSTFPLIPVPESERVEILDVLRGFALFGILLVNMSMFSAPFDLALSGVEWWSAPIDRAAALFVSFAAQGKFYSLFAFLFGLGAAIQLERAEALGTSFVRFFRRRMAWLFAIGLAHAFLVWFGDILVLYAALGFLLLPFLEVSDRALRVWIVVLLLVPLALTAGLVGLVEIARLTPEGEQEVEATFAAADADTDAAIGRAIVAYSGSSYMAATAQRARDVGSLYLFSPFHAPSVLALFLAGLHAGRRRLLHDPAATTALARKALPWLLVSGLVANAVMVAAALAEPHPGLPSPLGLLSQLGSTVGAPALCFFYVSAIVLAEQRPAGRRLLAPLAPVGRMALTNYLLQSVVCTLLFNGYGLGLYARVPPSVGLVLSVAIFALELLLSAWWLRRFRFGPVEWLWRRATYGRPQPMRT